MQRLPVRIQLDPRQLAEHLLRVGLSMKVDIDVSEEGSGDGQRCRVLGVSPGECGRSCAACRNSSADRGDRGRFGNFLVVPDTGVSNFMRTLAAAFGAALIQTGWSDASRVNQTELSGAMTQAQSTIDAMTAGGATAGGATPEAAIAGLSQIVEGQSVMLATIDMFGVAALVFLASATLIWMAPKPVGPIDTSGAN